LINFLGRIYAGDFAPPRWRIDRGQKPFPARDVDHHLARRITDQFHQRESLKPNAWQPTENNHECGS